MLVTAVEGGICAIFRSGNKGNYAVRKLNPFHVITKETHFGRGTVF
jgi:hypothetical protein